MCSWFNMLSLRTTGRWTYELVEARGIPNKELDGSDEVCSAIPLLNLQTCMLFTAMLNLKPQNSYHYQKKNTDFSGK